MKNTLITFILTVCLCAVWNTTLANKKEALTMADSIGIETDNAEVAAYARDGRLTGTFEVSIPTGPEPDPQTAMVKLTYDEVEKTQSAERRR